jgi:hypothetical protein
MHHKSTLNLKNIKLQMEKNTLNQNIEYGTHLKNINISS